MKAPLPIFLLLLAGSTCFCQTVQKRHTGKISCEDLFKQYAMALPRLYERKDFDSIQYLTEQREQHCDPEPDIFCIRLLLAIERNTFTKDQLAGMALYDILDDYAGYERQFLKGRGRLGYYSTRYFDATRYDKNIFSTTTAWARQLLGSGRTDSMESFLCHVFAGDVRHPGAAIRQDNGNQATLNGLMAESAILRRNGAAINYAMGIGAWIPNGRLATLGVHPAVTLPVIGLRNKLNQLDWVCSLRFLRSANDYTVLRGGNLYTRHYFLGGYIGFDYTRYFIHSFHFESGIIAGAGYDAFDIDADSEYYHDHNNLKPQEIKSFNANLGLRCNYFFNPAFYIGAAAKYNVINYCNPGGTSMDGDAVSIDFYAGVNMPWFRRYR